MCLICIEFDKSAMNLKEARRALGEMRGDLDKKHVEEVEAKLDEAEKAQTVPKPYSRFEQRQRALHICEALGGRLAREVNRRPVLDDDVLEGCDEHEPVPSAPHRSWAASAEGHRNDRHPGA